MVARLFFLFTNSITHKDRKNLMKRENKEVYSKPELTVHRIYMKQNLLSMSETESVSLTGAGVNESDADSNGDEIW